ncbi:MAG: hypothetical protein ACI8RZ_002500 [Myxococcota bacterium]|jgi:hypothetical protein
MGRVANVIVFARVVRHTVAIDRHEAHQRTSSPLESLGLELLHSGCSTTGLQGVAPGTERRLTVVEAVDSCVSRLKYGQY